MKFNFQIESHVLMTLVLHLGNSDFTLYSTKNEAHTTTTKTGAFKFPVRVYEFLHRKKSYSEPKDPSIWHHGQNSYATSLPNPPLGAVGKVTQELHFVSG